VLALNGMRAISDPKRDPSPTPPSQQHQFQVRATTLQAPDPFAVPSGVHALRVDAQHAGNQAAAAG
jgi:hypothetical protein